MSAVFSPVLSRRVARLSLCAVLSAAALVAEGGGLRASAQASPNPWWKHAVVYEIYPRSFQDSNGDGIGDLKGITSRMGYLQELGVDAIWIAPMYPSPQVDFGYDIADYQAVDPQYGTMADMDKLIAEGKQHKVRVVLDMVLNHTSDKHQWFIDSASSKTNPKHDWYVWNDGVPDQIPPASTTYQKKYVQTNLEGKQVVPPNNWESLFGGSAWEWVPAVHQYYYHKFYKQQPDLNWSNPGGRKSCLRCHALLARPRRRWLPSRCHSNLVRRPANAERAGDWQAPTRRAIPTCRRSTRQNLPEVHDVIRRMRTMVANGYRWRPRSHWRNLPPQHRRARTSGTAVTAHNELQLPMDFLVGFHGDHDKLNATRLPRPYLQEVETQVYGSQPLLRLRQSRQRSRHRPLRRRHPQRPHQQNSGNTVLSYHAKPPPLPTTAPSLECRQPRPPARKT